MVLVCRSMLSNIIIWFGTETIRAYHKYGLYYICMSGKCQKRLERSRSIYSVIYVSYSIAAHTILYLFAIPASSCMVDESRSCTRFRASCSQWPVQYAAEVTGIQQSGGTFDYVTVYQWRPFTKREKLNRSTIKAVMSSRSALEIRIHCLSAILGILSDVKLIYHYRHLP